MTLWLWYVVEEKGARRVAGVAVGMMRPDRAVSGPFDDAEEAEDAVEVNDNA